MALRNEMDLIRSCIKHEFRILSKVHEIPNGVVLVIHDDFINKSFVLTLRPINSQINIPKSEESPVMFSDFIKTWIGDNPEVCEG